MHHNESYFTSPPLRPTVFFISFQIIVLTLLIFVTFFGVLLIHRKQANKSASSDNNEDNQQPHQHHHHYHHYLYGGENSRAIKKQVAHTSGGEMSKLPYMQESSNRLESSDNAYVTSQLKSASDPKGARTFYQLTPEDDENRDAEYIASLVSRVMKEIPNDKTNATESQENRRICVEHDDGYLEDDGLF